MNDNILPDDFDGVFRFTNWTDEDFTAKWNNVAYTFPALKTVPLLIPTETLEGTQYVRRKFAKELAEREYFKGEKYQKLIGSEKNPTMQTGVVYNLDDLSDLIQKALSPLPLSKASVQVLPKDDERKYSKDKRGKTVTKVLDKDESLVGDGTVLAE